MVKSPLSLMCAAPPGWDNSALGWRSAQFPCEAPAGKFAPSELIAPQIDHIAVECAALAVGLQTDTFTTAHYVIHVSDTRILGFGGWTNFTRNTKIPFPI